MVTAGRAVLDMLPECDPSPRRIAQLLRRAIRRAPRTTVLIPLRPTRCSRNNPKPWLRPCWITSRRSNMADLKALRTDLSRFLKPARVAGRGVSNDATRIGGQALRLLTIRLSGKNLPGQSQIRRMSKDACYPDLKSVPQPCDVALIAARRSPRAWRHRAMRARRHPVRAGAVQRLQRIAPKARCCQETLLATARKANVRMVGPNCLAS